jgi:glycosyltransferase involved in cell wall biosynthesis
MPTRNEAFGLVYQEAAAAGIPAIGTRQNAVPEIVLDGETGLLVPVGDHHALGAALAALADSAELRHRLGTRGREIIEVAACPAAYLDRLTTILTEAAASRPSRGTL